MPRRQRSAPEADRIQIFISHASEDADVAAAVIELLRTALNLPALPRPRALATMSPLIPTSTLGGCPTEPGATLNAVMALRPSFSFIACVRSWPWSASRASRR